MAEYIDRGITIAKLKLIEVIEPLSTMFDARRLLADMPVADVAPVVHGRWIEDRSGIIICSECDRSYNLSPRYTHYCPNCGAKMDGET